ncbi:phasin family protein [[Empedobacter] haloabium]|uniref:Phasin family protein n=1 Tax=[Empedobacter] haloabium TaxID=592317 RepID=A0ABZ1UF67_9BURK
MFPFSPSVTPAVRSHLDAQVAFLNDMSKSLSRSFQDLCQLNIQLSQTLLEESAIAGQKLLTTDRPDDVISIAASRAQPASEKLRAYQQHISRVAADAQVELARVAEQHVQETSRTARALADQVARVTAEESDRSKRQQEESIRTFQDPFQHGAARNGNGASAHGHLQADSGSGNLQVDGEAQGASFHGNVQGTQPAQSSGKGGKAAQQ